MRLDKYLVEKGYAATRAKAQDAIQAGRVLVNSQIVVKNSYDLKEEDQVEVKEAELSFVSRAGFKLYDVLEPFEINLEGKTVIDVGASTGGFSDVCLRQGAAHVYALDVGSDQLDPSLCKDPRISNMEHVNCRYLTKNMFDRAIDFCCTDVSFISLKLLLPAIASVMDRVEIVALIKPQFEAGKQAVGKHGIVKDAAVHLRVLQDMEQFLHQMGLYVHHAAASSVLGRDGNKEFVFHIKDEAATTVFDYRRIIKEYSPRR